MTITVWAVVGLLLGHWVADFVWQPHWMGMRKSKEWWVLTQHAARITLGAYLTAWVIDLLGKDETTIGPLVAFALINGAGHFAIDAVTSRITGKLYVKGDMHNFFVVIGFDQFLHVALAVWTLAWWIL